MQSCSTLKNSSIPAVFLPISREEQQTTVRPDDDIRLSLSLNKMGVVTVDEDDNSDDMNDSIKNILADTTTYTDDSDDDDGNSNSNKYKSNTTVSITKIKEMFLADDGDVSDYDDDTDSNKTSTSATEDSSSSSSDSMNKFTSSNNTDNEDDNDGDVDCDYDPLPFDYKSDCDGNDDGNSDYFESSMRDDIDSSHDKESLSEDIDSLSNDDDEDDDDDDDEEVKDPLIEQQSLMLDDWLFPPDPELFSNSSSFPSQEEEEATTTTTTCTTTTNDAGAANDAMAEPPSFTTVNDEVNDDVTSALMKLSLTDRTAIEEEIHGVLSHEAHGEKESPFLLQKSLYEFDIELYQYKNSISIINSNLCGTDKDVLRNTIWISKPTTIAEQHLLQQQQALLQSSTSIVPNCYLNDPNVRLRFLRFEYFNARKALERFVCFLEFTFELFGDFVAYRPICISDFETNNYDMNINNNHYKTECKEFKIFLNSRFQYLPIRDRSGRRVWVGVGKCLMDIEPILRYKIIMYQHWIASEDIETQQKGLVMIVWPSQEAEPTDPTTTTTTTTTTPAAGTGGTGGDDTWEKYLRPNICNRDVSYHKRSFQAVPVRVASTHFCGQNTPINRVLSSLYYFGLPSPSPSEIAGMNGLQTRYRTHFGEPIEIRYELQSYGIPVDLLPLTHNLAVKTKNHSQWVQFRRNLECQQKQHLFQKQQQKQQQSLVLLCLQRNGYNMKSNNIENKVQQVQTQQKKQEQKQNALASSSSLVLVQRSVECPRSYDVIFRTGKHYGNHIGNSVFLHKLMERTYKEHRDSSTQSEKVDLTWRIVREIERKNGRFLEWDRTQNVWIHIIDPKKKREKIAQSLKVYTKQQQKLLYNKNKNNNKMI